MKWSIPDYTERIVRQLNENGYEAYLVGGCVRDLLLGRTPKDWDITTSAAPGQVKQSLSGFRIADTGLKHGTVTAIDGEGSTAEITTYRVESAYSDHRHPDQVRFTRELKEDLARRDFTINAMAYHPDGGLIDFYGGQEDLARRRLRCVGDPTERFNEDALRILRALRFASALQLRIAPETADAVHRCRASLAHIASERIYSEMTKLLCGSGVRPVLEEFSDVIAVFIPELTPCFGFQQHSPYHNFDVYTHTLRALENVPSCAYMRWAMLLHDTGKPHTFTMDAQHRGHFKGHEGKSAEIADTVLRRLHASNQLRERVCLLIRYHDADLTPNSPCLTKWLNRIGPEALLQLIQIQRADDLAKSAAVRYRTEKADALTTMVQALLADHACYTVRDLAIDGSDLLAIGYPPGKALGETLDRLLAAVIDGTCPNERKALLHLAAEWR